MQVVEYRGKDIVKEIFEAVTGKDGLRLLPEDFRAVCKGAPEMLKMRTISDFIAGMTDRYAFEFYGRLHGTNHLTVHKPLWRPPRPLQRSVAVRSSRLATT
ncbi:MAG: hypothetical protein ACLQF1_08065 [Methyloceanibacter sp.]